MRAESKLYLRQDVVAEPLFNHWYAWSHLISPAQAAMFTANLHLKILQSFITNPQLHVSAVKNPAMLGGPFVNYDESRVDEIKNLMEKIRNEQAHLIEFAEAVKKLDEMLLVEASGFSLEPLYRKVPDALKGYVELVYELNNSPTVRFLEGLLYKSRYYDELLQSIALHRIDRDDRPFILSSPILKDEGMVHLNTCFRHEGLDELFRARFEPQSPDYLKEVLGVGQEDEKVFFSFFTEEAPELQPQYAGDGVRIRYFGHACVLFESGNVSILSDPLISYKYNSENDRFTYADLPESIDYVVITHSHSDHFILESLLQLRHRIKNLIVPKSVGGGLADPSLKLILRHIGFNNVIEIDEMEAIEIEGGLIMGLPFLGEHADLHIRSKIAYLVSLGDRTALLAADSNNIEPKLYQHIHEFIGDIDIAFLGMECVGAPMTWSYGPLLTKTIARKMDQSRRFVGSDSEKAIELVRQLNAQQVYIYAMGEEPWLTHLTSLKYTDSSPQIIESNRLIEYCRSLKITAERLYGRKEIPN